MDNPADCKMYKIQILLVTFKKLKKYVEMVGKRYI